MTIGNALSFIMRGIDDNTLRNRLNAATCPSELTTVLSDEKLVFSAHDFEEAFHHQLTLCQKMEDADQLREFKLWWELLSAAVSPGACVPQCRDCGAQSF